MYPLAYQSYSEPPNPLLIMILSLSSCLQTIDALVHHPLLPVISVLDLVLRLSTRFVRPAFCKLWTDFYDGDFSVHGKRRYHEHCEEIRRLVPKERLLEYNVSEGWKPLCDFLGHAPPPSVEFPRGNDIQVFKKNFKHMMLVLLSFYAKKVIKIGSFAVASYTVIRWLRLA
jgi:hypothetical protein